MNENAPGNNTRMAGEGGTPPSGAPGDNTKNTPMLISSQVTHKGATTIDKDTENAEASYTSTTGGESALLVTGGTVALDAPIITKTGNDSGDSADFYGTNAAVLAMDGASLNISGGSVETDGEHANAVFSYGTGTTIEINETKITTKNNTSGGIMVTGGGKLNATNLTVETSGNSSAAIRSDRGGGTITVDGGTYTTHGVGSPAIYSTADISVKDAILTSTSSEGVVIEGLNSVSLSNVTLTDTNNQLNGQSETYKNIFIYQSMSGDAEKGTGTFTAKNSKVITNQGDHFFITNTTAVINLMGTKFTQNDAGGGFLRAQTSKWGTEGKNGGQVTVNADRQEIIGNINIDGISSLQLNLSTSYVKAGFYGEGTKNLKVSKDSVIVLTGDSYITTLENEDETNSNIYANGFKLYVSGQEAQINQEAAPESFLVEEVTETVVVTNANTTGTDSGFPLWGWFAIAGCVVVIIVAVILIIKKKKDQGKPIDYPGQIVGSSTGTNTPGSTRFPGPNA